MLNSTRDRIEPCSTPYLKGQDAEQTSPSTTMWDLWARKEWNHPKNGASEPQLQQLTQKDTIVDRVEGLWEVQQDKQQDIAVMTSGPFLQHGTWR